ncbi:MULTISPECIES: carbohydrate kinase family protein [Streptomyces]|uniref:Putative Adenosine kinase n=1 Tax=Streptomyces venezuelae (strain ATCC 10712 / CBS 650.69 / DSM 40230 / JCM 4526 / NBRC 13096 / PD 04745) TaxID=953739 RepID=F2RH39_STRVP|nr:carbohydrate kinase family protein [Streptomyces venezuelae]APE23089.1 carbohydrate kinase family protein [Streptomyces venezuelae]QES00470.1 carbohydrate kinase family protein [Streptomyces venezuelae ATCC 10712]CCA57367.1 putative Adenosine kinase [Streptomyces venezuelae ATCC 10712]
MRIAVTGSIATDHLMTFPGWFSEQLLADRLDKVSLSFLADNLEVRRGGVAANIAFGLGVLGLRPALVGAVGADFEPYRVWLKDHGVDTDSVRVSESLHTARFVCTTDRAQNQIATFYAGAMAEAREIDLRSVVARTGRLELVLVSPDDPEAMLRHTRTCRDLGIPFAADPSQQLARLDGEQVRELVDGARFLFTNEYETALLLEKTGWTEADVLRRVGTWVTTHGEAGVRIRGEGREPLAVPAVQVAAVVDPTGVGDAFRSGFLAGWLWGVPERCAAQLGCAVAATVLDYVGTQEYRLHREPLLDRIRTTYGTACTATLVTHLRTLS